MRLALPFVLVLCVSAPLPARVKIICDTDMDTDCDDAGALAVLHGLADRGEGEILATMVSSQYPWSAPCVEAINRYYGRADLPIGASIALSCSGVFFASILLSPKRRRIISA